MPGIHVCHDSFICVTCVASRDECRAAFLTSSPTVSVCLSVCLSVGLSVCLSICLSVCLFVCLSIYLSVSVLVCASATASTSAYAYACMFACVSLCACACPSYLYYLHMQALRIWHCPSGDFQSQSKRRAVNTTARHGTCGPA